MSVKGFDTVTPAPVSTVADPARALLANQWLDYFGAIAPEELDLGTLVAIGEYVRDGLAPCDILLK